MEFLDPVWQIGIIALVAGVLIGVLAYRLLAPSLKQADQVKSELDDAREELADYKANVNQHFEKTSELVNDLTQNYVKVYQHLAEGAQSLGDNKSFDNLLEQQQGKVAIAVDDETTAAEKAAAAATVAAAAATVASADEEKTPAAGAPAAGVPVDETVAANESVEPTEARVEPAQAAAAAAPDSVAPDGQDAETRAAKASADPASPPDAIGPVINIDALDKTGEIAKGEARGDGSSPPEGDEKTEPRATTH